MKLEDFCLEVDRLAASEGATDYTNMTGGPQMWRERFEQGMTPHEAWEDEKAVGWAGDDFLVES